MCEFCREFDESGKSRFSSIYGAILQSRIAEETANFIAIPTMGQLFLGSILILPKEHFETFGLVPKSLLPEFSNLLQLVVKKVTLDGKYVIFEHGAKEASSGGCGIYHAHIHVVPVPALITVSDLLPSGSDILHQVDAESFTSVYQKEKFAPEYLVCRDTEGGVRFVNVGNSDKSKYPSQYFRRVLSEFFGLKTPWDWRLYPGIEPNLLKTLHFFRSDLNIYRPDKLFVPVSA